MLEGSAWAVMKARATVGAKTFSVVEWDNCDAGHEDESMQSLSTVGEIDLKLVKPCFPVGRGNSQATKVRPTLQSPSRSNELPDEEATQVDEEQSEDRSSQKHAAAQPEETDHANAPVEFWGFLVKRSTFITFNLTTFRLFLPMQLVPFSCVSRCAEVKLYQTLSERMRTTSKFCGQTMGRRLFQW